MRAGHLGQEAGDVLNERLATFEVGGRIGVGAAVGPGLLEQRASLVDVRLVPGGRVGGLTTSFGLTSPCESGGGQ